MIPEPGSEWPVRLLSPEWALSDAVRVGRGTWRGPRDASWNWRNDARVSSWLYRMVRAHRPVLAVETGVWLGKSTVALLSALRKNGAGRLVSIDRSPAAAGTGCLVPADLARGRWVLQIGDARDLVPGLPDRVDLFLHDSDHSRGHQAFEYAEAWRRLPIGGVLASDDTDWSPAWAEFVAAHRAQIADLPPGPGSQRAVVRTGRGP